MQQDNRKYRLLKDLPETEKGSIFIWNDELGAYVWNEGTYQTESGKTCVPAFKRNTIENNPDWFEEVKQDVPDWEILKCRNDIFGVHDFVSEGNNPTPCFNKKNPCEIFSVRRVRDGEVFSIGDKVGWGEVGNYKTNLTSFRIEKGRLEFGYDGSDGKSNYFCDFEQAVILHKKLPPSTPAPLKENKPYVSFDTYDIHLTQSQLDGMMENVWGQARMLAIDMPITGYLGTGLKYNTFNDYRVTLPENTPTPPKEESKERVEVMLTGIQNKNVHAWEKFPHKLYPCTYEFHCEKEVPKDKFPAIKQAIEKALNEDTVIEDKPVLHISDDGKEMTEGDREYTVDLDSWEIYQMPTSEIINKDYRNNNKIFSTKEAAEQYILENKPCLSLNDLLPLWTDKYNITTADLERYRNSDQFKRFQQKAKSKQ